MGNDANLMGLGETMYGAGQGAQNVCSDRGTGIGGAVVIGGKLFNGLPTAAPNWDMYPHRQRRTLRMRFCGCLEHLRLHFRTGAPFQQACRKAGISFPGEEINGELIVRLYKKETSWQRMPGRALRFSGTRHRRIHQHLQPATHRNRRRTVRSRRLLYPESQRKGTPLCHSRLCREHSNHGCIFR